MSKKRRYTGKLKQDRSAFIAALQLFQPRRGDHIEYKYVGSATLECYEDGKLRPLPSMAEREQWHRELLTDEQLEAMSDAELAELKRTWINTPTGEELFQQTVKCFS